MSSLHEQCNDQCTLGAFAKSMWMLDAGRLQASSALKTGAGYADAFEWREVSRENVSTVQVLPVLLRTLQLHGTSAGMKHPLTSICMMPSQNKAVSTISVVRSCVKSSLALMPLRSDS